MIQKNEIKVSWDQIKNKLFYQHRSGNASPLSNRAGGYGGKFGVSWTTSVILIIDNWNFKFSIIKVFSIIQLWSSGNPAFFPETSGSVSQRGSITGPMLTEHFPLNLVSEYFGFIFLCQFCYTLYKCMIPMLLKMRGRFTL